MISPAEMIVIKNRLMMSADIAHRIATKQEDMLLSPHDYQIAMAALAALPSDVNRLLAEVDVLRGMFAERVTNFMEGLANGVTDRHVDSLPERAAGQSGKEEQPEQQGADCGVPAGRPRRRRATRSKSRRDSPEMPGGAEEVGPRDAT